MDEPGEDIEGAWTDWLAPQGEAVPLDRATARLAAEECGGDPAAALAALDALASEVPRSSDPTDQLARLIQHLFGTLGFCGDSETYTDPANSCIDRVIARRRGLPITLSVLTVEVARRLDLPLLPIGYPGHFLVGTSSEPRVFLDPFAGGVIRPTSALAHDLSARLGRTPEPRELEAALAPMGVRDVLVRMSTNLIRSWLERGRSRDALRNADRRVALRPDLPDLRRERGLLRAQLGDREGAAMDLGTYLQEVPDADDAVRVRWQLSVLLGR